MADPTPLVPALSPGQPAAMPGVANDANRIRAIPTASVSKICSGQVVLDLATAVKELVENALDAGATSVEIRLKEHGLDLIEVADNGKGVPPEDYAALALKYHTSKISQFHDLEALHTFGFRGEALSSLSALGELSVTTRTAAQAAATRLEYDRDGRLAATSSVARAVGTTVAVKDLFGPLPVRRREFARNVRREVAKLKLLLQQYAIMSTQAQLFASDQSGKSARTVLVSTSNAGGAVAERVSAVLGSKVAALLVPLEVGMEGEGITIKGLVSRAGCGVKGDKLRQFFCINGRPVELPRAIKALNDAYKSLYSSMVGLRPMAFLSLELPPGTFDVNVTPDKRSVFVQKEVAIMTALGQAVQALWEPARYTFAVNATQEAFDTQRQQPSSSAAAAAAAAVRGASTQAGAGGGEGGGTAGGGDAAGSDDDEPAPVGAAAAGGTDMPPSLAAFMIGSSSSGQQEAAAGAAPHRAAANLQQQQQQLAAGSWDDPAAAAAAAAAAAGEARGAQAAGARLAAGQKRLRPLEAALMGRRLPKASRPAPGPPAPAAAAEAAAEADEAAAADTSVDVAGDPRPPRNDSQEGQEEEEEEEREDDEQSEEVSEEASPRSAQQQQQDQERRRRQQQQQQQHQRQQPPPLLPLASFQLHGGSDGGAAAGGEGGTPAEGLQDAAGNGRGLLAPRTRSSSGSKSLAAFGFHVLKQQPQGQQQDEAQDDGQDGAQQQHRSSSDQNQQQQQQQQQQLPDDADGEGCQEPSQQAASQQRSGSGGSCEPTAAAAAAGGVQPAAGSEDDDDEPVLVQEVLRGPAAVATAAEAAGPAAEAGADAAAFDGEDERQQQQQLTQQQQQQQHTPVVVDYSMQQLMADMEARMQQLRLRQQQPGSGTAAGPGIMPRRLAAASLQGQSDAAGVDGAAGEGGQPGAPTPDAAAAAAADAATAELTRVFNKAEFASMAAVGQFNLGFIIARLGQDLFIVDQHAADEKSTYERLLAAYAVNKQPLLQPRRLTTLTAMDQQVIREHMEVLTRNGFEFVESAPGQQRGQGQAGARPLLWGRPPRSKAAAAAAAAAADSADDADAAAAAAGADAGVGDQGAAAAADADMDMEAGGSELLLSAVPVLRGGAAAGGSMGEETLLELLDLIAAGEQRASSIRPKRVRDMLASRACRTSIMIGSPLAKQQQARILARLAELDAPFNCPHGRPTMRHLAVLPPSVS